jgi:hypothetical protein
LNEIFSPFHIDHMAGCSGKTDNSTLTDTLKMSKAQAFLSNLKDSMVFQYNSAESYKQKQMILDTFVRQLQSYLRKNPLDSIRVTVDEVTAEGFTVKTKSHFNRIEFSSKITFKDSMPPRPDSIYKFMKSLKPGSNVLVNFGYTKDFEINLPDTPMISTFKIDAFPVPIQYKSK